MDAKPARQPDVKVLLTLDTSSSAGREEHPQRRCIPVAWIQTKNRMVLSE